METMHAKNLYEGFVVGKDKVHVSILQFALFCKYNDDMLEVLIQRITPFETCLGFEK